MKGLRVRRARRNEDLDGGERGYAGVELDDLIYMRSSTFV